MSVGNVRLDRCRSFEYYRKEIYQQYYNRLCCSIDFSFAGTVFEGKKVNNEFYLKSFKNSTQNFKRIFLNHDKKSGAILAPFFWFYRHLLSKYHKPGNCKALCNCRFYNFNLLLYQALLPVQPVYQGR